MQRNSKPSQRGEIEITDLLNTYKKIKRLTSDILVEVVHG